MYGCAKSLGRIETPLAANLLLNPLKLKIMDEKMLAVFAAKFKENQSKLVELLKALDLAELGQKMQDEQCDDICNQVLAENEFFASKEYDRHPAKIKIGDRILDESDTFLLSQEDFQRLQDLKRPIMIERNITDEKGYFTTDWLSLKMEAWRNLVDFIILNVVPASMRKLFWEKRLNVVFGYKLIDAFRKSLVAA